MQAKIRSAASHGLMACLLSLGLTLTLLGVTGLLRHWGTATAVLLLMTTAVSAISLNRRAALATGCAALFTGMLWLLIGGGSMIVELFRALLLHMSGLTTALPLVGLPFTLTSCVLTLAVSWFVTQRSAGAYPALILLVLIAVLLWLGNMADMFMCLLPAVIACVTLLLRAGDEHTSTLRVLPLAALVTGIAFIGVAADGAVSPPMKKLADDIRQRIYDTLFYTQPRDVFTLATEGWYPQGQSQLGGPANPHEQPVMAVIAPRKVYLRGVIKNVYTGRTWLDDIGGRRYLWSSPRFEERRGVIFDQTLPALDGTADSALLTPRLLQVRMLRDSASTLFVPQRLRLLTPEGTLIPYFNGSSEVFATANLKLGDVWTAEAALFTSADPGLPALVNAADTPEDPNWKNVCDTYMQLPEHLQAEVFQIAAEAVQGADTPYGKALALQLYLASNYTYTLDAAVQKPEQDFVSTFLLADKKGYCTYFASAMTVLCRMAGLPARYVEGYVAYPNEEGMALVTGKEGHAWTEVYFRGFGWVTFDATPTSVDYTGLPPEDFLPDSESPERSPEPTPTPTPHTEPSVPPEQAPTPTPETEYSPAVQAPSAQSDSTEQNEEPSGTTAPLWILLLSLLVLLLRLLYVQPDFQAKRQTSEFRRWLVYVQAAHDALRRYGLTRNRAETPAAFLERAGHSGKLSFSLQPLANAENLMFYGHAAPYAEETSQAREIFMAAYRPLGVGQKLLFQLQRCLPAARFDITRK